MKSHIYITLILLSGFSFSISAQQLSLQWAQRLGCGGWDYTNSMIKTSTGNYLIGGSLQGTLPNDSTHSELMYSNNAYLATCDTNGNILWQRTFGGTKFENITDMVKTPEGILISGIFQDTIRFNNELASTKAYTGGYLAMVNEQGNPIWLQNIGGLATVKQILLCSCSTGKVFIAGSFADSLQLGGVEKATTGENGLFIAMLSSDRIVSNPLVFKGTGICTLGGFSCNDSIICLAGSFSDTLYINDTTLVSFGEEDVFIALFSNDGVLKHLTTACGIGNEQVRSITFTPSGDIGITGSFDYSILIQNKILQTFGGKDIFVAVIDTTGNLKWIKSIGGVGDDLGYTITANNNDDFFLTGNFVHYLSMPDENGNLIEMDAENAFGNAFIAKYNSLGDLKASYNLPATSEDYCKSIIVNGNGTITTAGNFYQSLELQDLGGQAINLITEGERDIFILRFMDMCNNVTIDAGPDTTLCPGQSIYLVPPGSFAYYRWLPDGLPNQDLEVNQPGTYRLLVTNEFGCIASDSIKITLNQIPIAYAGNDTLIAAGENLQLMLASASNATTVEWASLGTGYFNNLNEINTIYTPSYSDISEGLVQLTLIASNQCGSGNNSFILSIDQDDDGITAFPNPTEGMVTLVCNEGIKIQSASIATQAGNVIQANITVNNSVMQYDLSAYPPGTFLFHLTTATGTVTKIINKL